MKPTAGHDSLNRWPMRAAVPMPAPVWYSDVMPDRFTEEDVRHIARLARLHLDDAQIHQYQSQLAAVLEHVRKLDELDLADVEPLSHSIELTNHLAEDVPEPSLSIEPVLHNAPQVEGPFIAVPKVLADSGGG